MSRGHCHIKLGVVQHSQGDSALARLAYQMNTAFNDGKRHANYSRYRGQHLGGLILLPPAAPAKFADPCDFVMAVGFREKRKDAQAGRTADFALPREIPDELLLPVAAFVMAAFAAQGMAVRIDVECPLASDNDRNPHGHGYIAQRVIEAGDFGRKGREWDAQFRRDSGRHMRAVIAARVTWACALLGIAAFVDPRTNEERGRPPPEERFLTKHWRMHDRHVYLGPIDKLKAERRKRKLADAVSTASVDTSGTVVIKSAVSRRHPLGHAERSRRMNLVVPLAQDSGAEAFQSTAARDEITLTTRDGSIAFDGETFTIVGTAAPARARLIVEFAQALDWPALVVEGDARWADEIFVAGAPAGITAINRCASERAVRLIQRNYGHLLADTIRQLDPLSDVANALEAAHVEAGTIEPRIDTVEAPENSEFKPDFGRPGSPKTPVAEDVRLDDFDRPPVLLRNLGLDAEDDSDAAHSKRGSLAPATPSEPKQSYPEFVSNSDEFDMPEPSRPTAAEEELRRLGGAALWESWIAEKFKGLQWNPARDVRVNRAPPKPRESGPL
jgi:hypothetical protein